MMRDGNGPAEPWEHLLREGLEALSAPVEGENPPDLGTFLMLVHDVQRAQRQALLQDLRRFLAVAAPVLAGSLWTLLQFPVYYVIAQIGLAAVLVIGALVWQAEGRRRAFRE